MDSYLVNIMSSKKAEKKSKKGSNRGSSSWSSPPGNAGSSSSVAALIAGASGGGGVGGAGSSLLPEGTRARLWELFGQIEHEFELLHVENAALRDRVDKLELLVSERSAVDVLQEPTSTFTPVFGEAPLPPPGGGGGGSSSTGSTPLKKMKMKTYSGQAITKRLRRTTPAKKGRSGTTAECVQVCMYEGHRDGVWEVSHARNGLPVIGTASADGTACIWDVDTGHLLLKYMGHSGSVNSIAFHPREPLACTVSGDNGSHVWSFSVNVPSYTRQRSGSNADRTNKDSSGEDHYLSDDDPDQGGPVTTLKTPLLTLSGHKAPVMCCDWLSDGQKLVTASWDHTAKLWDFESAQVIHSLEGHDGELTHACAHPTQQLLVTSSQDATFRLWDFRAPPIHSVNVFQGHSKAVNAATFSLRDYVVSGSDDHTLKIWELRNMRSPVDSIRLDCGVNRISVSHNERGILAVPLDNKHIRLYDLSGNRLGQLPRNNRQGHRRMVYSVAWSPDSHVTSEKCNLFSAGFDNRVIGWKITV